MMNLNKPLDHCIFLKNGGHHIRVDLDKIIFIEAVDNYCNIVTSNRRFIQNSTLKRIQEQLCNKGFLRVHRSFVINIGKITKFNESNFYFDDVIIPVGRTFKSEVFKALPKI